jgi:hypothetical protein
MSYFDKYNKYKSKYDVLKNHMNQMNQMNQINFHGGHNIVKNTSFNINKIEKSSCDHPHHLTEDHENRCKAHMMGEKMLEEWLAARTADGAIDRIVSMFDENGIPYVPPTATAFNDLYKWTMMPVIRKLESYKNNNVIVTFGIDLRDAEMRAEMRRSPVLITKIHQALKGLEIRPFDKRVFNSILQGPRAKILDPSDVNVICLQDGAYRTLVDSGGVKNYDDRVERTEEEDRLGKVTIKFYYDAEKQYKDGEMGVHFIEATGPWHRVSWLETSMMQCVYEAKLRYDLEQKHLTYYDWLYGALLRCAKSVAYTHIVQIKKPLFKPALFTGRRTGGLLFLLLQNLFFADHFLQFNGPVVPASPHPTSLIARTGAGAGAGSESGSGEAPTALHYTIKNVALGTSSVDCWHILKSIGLPCLAPAGTHAHELSMVTSVLFPHVDQNLQHLPLTQIIGHYLYYELVWKKTGGLMAMLPDTLGTRAFMKAANYVTIPKADGGRQRFLDIIQTARQDSGKLKNFIRNMKDFGYTNDGTSAGTVKAMMASEIDDTEKLLEAAQLDYATFGAGGFFGDAEKVWGNPKASSNSMAVKAVRVKYVADTERDYSTIGYMRRVGDVVVGFPTKVMGYPVKIGDQEDFDHPRLAEGKLSLDKNLPIAELAPIKAYAELVRVSAQNRAVAGTKNLETFFTVDGGVNYGGLVGGGETNSWFNMFFA